jgi:hypothetical protein
MMVRYFIVYLKVLLDSQKTYRHWQVKGVQ